MRVADTSVLVAAFASWHPGHEAALAALDSDVVAAEHSLLETFSVLTRLPPPHRIAADIAASWLQERLQGRAVRPKATSVITLPETAASLGISGGAIYDALIGLTARDADAPLLTRDLRAVRTYELLGVRSVVVG